MGEGQTQGRGLGFRFRLGLEKGKTVFRVSTLLYRVFTLVCNFAEKRQYASLGGGYGITSFVVRLMLTRGYAAHQTMYSVKHGVGHSKFSQFGV